MMTKMSVSMSPEGFLMVGASGRMEKLLGNFSSSDSFSGDLNDLKEEDVWGTWPDAGSNPDKAVENYGLKREMVASEPVGTNRNRNRNRIIQNGRPQQKRGFETGSGGLSVALEDSNIRSHFSLLTTTSKAPTGRSISMKMIPHAGDNNTRHMMQQSAPVNVLDWTKIVGDNPFRSQDEEECEIEKLPPHEYLAREQMSRSVFQGLGSGRTLKGRDMRRVRNAVWSQTGFPG